MTNHALIAGAVASLVALLTACAAPEPTEASDTTGEEHVGKTDEAMTYAYSGTQYYYTTTTTYYTCSSDNGCYVDSNNQCMCQNQCKTCWGGWGYYAWNPCASGQSLYCNSYGTCWCQ